MGQFKLIFLTNSTFLHREDVVACIVVPMCRGFVALSGRGSAPDYIFEYIKKLKVSQLIQLSVGSL